MTTVTLHNSIKMPTVGLGTYLSAPGFETQQAVEDALALGYRHIDTASAYGNEKDVGRAVAKSGVLRNEIFITTKLWNDEQGYESTLKAIETSLRKLATDYVDLYLIHWPIPKKRLESYRALENLYESKTCRAIGVSNFTIQHLEELLTHAKIVPMVNQVEFSPFLYQKELLNYCNKHHIQVVAYSPLTQGKRLSHPVLTRIAKHHHRTSAQIMLRWAIQHGLVVIPKSAHRNRIQENLDVFSFSLTMQQMKELDALHDGFRGCPDPEQYG